MSLRKPLAFVRKQLKSKGKSLHSGRGFYVCYSDKTNSELLSAAKQKLQSWLDKGYVSNVDVNDDTCLSITLNKDVFDGSYRRMTFTADTRFSKSSFSCGICFDSYKTV